MEGEFMLRELVFVRCTWHVLGEMLSKPAGIFA